jgi:hypothetical protein
LATINLHIHLDLSALLGTSDLSADVDNVTLSMPADSASASKTDLFALLARCRVKNPAALIEEYPADEIVAVCKRAIDSQARNPGGYVVTGLRKGWCRSAETPNLKES